MYGYLGELIFETPIGVDGFSKDVSIVVSEQNKIQAKPSVQISSQNLDKASLELSFNRYFCDPSAKILQLEEIVRAGKPLPLVFANGTYKGKYIVDKINEQVKRTDPKGNIISATVSVSLIEFPEESSEKTPKQKNGKPLADSAFPKQKKLNDVAAQSARNYIKDKPMDVVSQTISRSNINPDFIKGIQNGYNMTAST